MILGDAAAKGQADNGSRSLQKLKTERKHAPVFDMVVEVRREQFLEWGIIQDTATAVDCILRGEPYTKEIRRQMPDGRVFVEISKG